MQVSNLVQIMGYIIINKEELAWEFFDLTVKIIIVIVVGGAIAITLARYGGRKEAEENFKKEREREEKIVAKIKKLNTSREDDNIGVLRKLSELHEKGILTDDEFEQKKRELLDKL